VNRTPASAGTVWIVIVIGQGWSPACAGLAGAWASARAGWPRPRLASEMASVRTYLEENGNIAFLDLLKH